MKNKSVVISGSGVFHPNESISNEALVDSFNQYVCAYNKQFNEEISRGEKEALLPSTAEFIEKVSGIKSRYVIDKAGILNPKVMHPLVEERPDEALSLQAEMGLNAAQIALKNAGKSAGEIDAVIVASSSLQRPFPAIAIEIQGSLGIDGFAFDMNVACASATFAIDSAQNLVLTGKAQSVLVINPEICSAYLNFKARDSHFILGDAATALVIEEKSSVSDNATDVFEMISTTLKTIYSNNVRNNFGFLGRLNSKTLFSSDKLFYQNGKKVFKEVSLAVSKHLAAHCQKENVAIDAIKRFCLHQANINMNQLIVKKLCGTQVDSRRAPMVLDEYANTASCGAVIAFDKCKKEVAVNEHVILSSFGAGYSIGSVLMKRIS